MFDIEKQVPGKAFWQITLYSRVTIDLKYIYVTYVIFDKSGKPLLHLRGRRMHPSTTHRVNKIYHFIGEVELK